MSYITPAQFREGLQGAKDYVDSKVVGGSVDLSVLDMKADLEIVDESYEITVNAISSTQGIEFREGKEIEVIASDDAVATGTWENDAVGFSFGGTEPDVIIEFENGEYSVTTDNYANGPYKLTGNIGVKKLVREQLPDLSEGLPMSVEWADVKNKPTLSTVAISGNYSDLTDAPTIMNGATSYNDGKEGLVTKPTTSDVNKALFGDGKWHTIYNEGHGATILVTTTESVLHGKTVTLTDGLSTLTAEMGNNGEAVFQNVSLFGTVIASAEDDDNNVAKASVNITYFGTYVVNLSLNYSTIVLSSTSPDVAGLVGTILKGTTEIGTVTMRLEDASLALSKAEFYVEEVGTYSIKFDTQTNGLFRGSVTVSEMKEKCNVNVLLYHVYAYCIDDNNSDPMTNIEYWDSPWGCENLEYNCAHMDFDNDIFDMGSWTGNEFFFPKKCMLKSNGIVDYYFDSNNDILKADGNVSSDYNNSSYNGNVMVEFPTAYFNRWQVGDKSYCVISDKKLSDDFHAYAHHDINGNVLPYIYISAYNGSYINGQLRSISNIPANTNTSTTSGRICNYTTRQQEINYAQTNNSGGQGEQWFTWHKADWDMLLDYMFLIGKSTDLQGTFGRGCSTGYVSTSNTGMVTTGSMDGKGMFWGENAGSAGVKVFFVENPYANRWNALAGWVNDKGTQKVKMTYGQEDGSTVNGFNLTGSGYVSISGATPSGTSGGYINKWQKTDKGFIPYQSSGSRTTYVPDGLWFDNSQNNYVFVGAGSHNGLLCGAAVALNGAPAVTDWYFGASLSYKGMVS